VAEGARLESVYTARYPGFESLSLRQTPTSTFTIICKSFIRLVIILAGCMIFHPKQAWQLGSPLQCEIQWSLPFDKLKVRMAGVFEVPVLRVGFS
jgi:hypothetical protein